MKTKMGKNKKYFRKTINFGKEGNRSRTIAEKIEKKVGKNGFSKIIQELLVSNFARDKQFEEIKINALLTERKDLNESIQKISKNLRENADSLLKLGIDIKL